MFGHSAAQSIQAIFSVDNVLMIVAVSFINVVCMIAIARKYMQIIQQSGYVYGDYKKWVLRRDNIYVTRIDMMVLLSVLAYLIYSIALSFADVNWVAPTAFIFYILFVSLYVRSDFKRKNKCPLVLTTRMTRLYVTYGVIFFLITLVALILISILGYFVRDNDILFRVRYCVICLSPLLVPQVVPLSNAVNKPFENANNLKYIEICKKKLAMYPDLIKIGITGSYGKTSVKEILRTLLSEKYNVLYTPRSYNTPLGICKAVAKLDDTYDVFIAEMGARHEGDIKELCDIVRPDYGIINGVIEHHMDTFVSLSQIVKTKSELIDGVGKGTVVLTADNEQTLSMAGGSGDAKIVIAGVNLAAHPYVYATDITVGAFGSKFTLHIGEKSAKCSTVLLGGHNVSNILLAAALCDKLGMSINEIAAGIARVRPISHRLELIKNENGVTVIDDSYNSNVNGTRAAIDVFKCFDGRKIVVTPGMVELGRFEDQRNFEFGQMLASNVDIAVLVGPHGAHRIREGLLSRDFPIDNIIMAKDLSDAMEKYKQLSASGDVVLFENDLPDKFS